jgi:hypothetical protein
MTTQYIHRIVIPAAFKLLPLKMGAREAHAELLAIGLQESRFKHRVQVMGPARGFWQFESGGGVRGVLEHKATRDIAHGIAHRLGYESTPADCFAAIQHNDILAAVFARLLLWSSPMPMPGAGNALAGWRLYLSTWRPGRPHPETWDEYFGRAWQLTMEE